jgi:glycosyltransferase involved in cell wall biosynthesis
LWPEAIFAYGRVKPRSLLGRLLTQGEHWIYRRADALIFTREGDVDYLREQGWTTEEGGDLPLSKCYYINNGVDLAAYRHQLEGESRTDAGATDGAWFTVTYTGSIRSVNNLGQVLDCALLLREYPRIRFAIYGEGSQLAMLKARAVSEGLSSVLFFGFVPRHMIPGLLSRSSVNLLNYSPDLFNWNRGCSSNKLFEYLASGRPVVSTIKTGYSIIDRYQCGIELEHYSPETLAQAILDIYDMTQDQRDTMGERAAKAAVEFDLPILTDRLCAVLDAVTKPRV